MSCNVPPVIKHFKAFCWHLYKENRWACSIWFWSQFDTNLTTAHKRRSFAGSSCKKKWQNFDTKSADKLLKVLPTYHWTDSLIIESVLLDWAPRGKREEPIVFPSIERWTEIWNANTFFFFFSDTPAWLVCHVLRGGVEYFSVHFNFFWETKCQFISSIHRCFNSVMSIWFFFQFFNNKSCV